MMLQNEHNIVRRSADGDIYDDEYFDDDLYEDDFSDYGAFDDDIDGLYDGETGDEGIGEDYSYNYEEEWSGSGGNAPCNACLT